MAPVGATWEDWDDNCVERVVLLVEFELKGDEIVAGCVKELVKDANESQRGFGTALTISEISDIEKRCKLWRVKIRSRSTHCYHIFLNIHCPHLPFLVIIFNHL